MCCPYPPSPSMLPRHNKFIAQRLFCTSNTCMFPCYAYRSHYPRNLCMCFSACRARKPSGLACKACTWIYHCYVDFWPRLQSLHLDLSLLCRHIPTPPQSLHLLFCLPCSQRLGPLHSLQVCFCFWCSHNPLPPHSAQCAFRLLCLHNRCPPRSTGLGLPVQVINAN